MIRRILEAIDRASVTDEERELVREFWSARESYDFYSKRGEAEGIKAAADRMKAAAGELVRRGFFRKVGMRMPTLDELGAP